jgi:signal transduction histidine kinase
MPSSSTASLSHQDRIEQLLRYLHKIEIDPQNAEVPPKLTDCPLAQGLVRLQAQLGAIRDLQKQSDQQASLESTFLRELQLTLGGCQITVWTLHPVHRYFQYLDSWELISDFDLGERPKETAVEYFEKLKAQQLPENDDAELDRILTSLQQNTPFEASYWHAVERNQRRCTRIVGRRHFRKRGEPTTLLGVKQDITDLAKAQQEQLKLEAKQQQQQRAAALGRLTANLGHELRTPLANVQVQLEMIEMLLEQGKTPNLATYFQRMHRGLGRASEIIDSMYRVSTGHHLAKHQHQAQSLWNLLNNALKAYSQTLFQRKIQVQIEVDKELVLPLLQAQMEQCIQHLYGNAIDAVKDKPDPMIRVSAYVSSSSVVIRVQDNGCGVSPEALPHIFEPFFTTKDVNAGTGMGLTLCRSVIEAHHGTLECESTLHEGTTMIICLPLT